MMGNGAIQIASQFSLNENVSDIITGIIIFFLIGSDFFVRYRVVFEKRFAGKIPGNNYERYSSKYCYYRCADGVKNH